MAIATLMLNVSVKSNNRAAVVRGILATRGPVVVTLVTLTSTSEMNYLEASTS